MIWGSSLRVFVFLGLGKWRLGGDPNDSFSGNNSIGYSNNPTAHWKVSQGPFVSLDHTGDQRLICEPSGVLIGVKSAQAQYAIGIIPQLC